MLTTLGEHIGYLADRRRLDRFRQALTATVLPGDTIADLGCGSGVLGLLCLEAGAGHVWGIDASDAIEIARETMVRAGLTDRYTCIRERSTRTVLPERVDLLICDHVGFFGIDYGIIEMIADARRRLLKPGGKVVPGRIKLLVAGISSAACREQIEAWRAPGIPSQFHWLHEHGINTKYARMFERDEVVAEPVALGTIDLAADSPDLLSFSATLRASHDLRLDGLGGWFDCELADGVWMTNSPLDDAAIDREQVFLPLERPIEVYAGEPIDFTLSIRHDSGLISWSAHDPRTGRAQKQSTWNSQILSVADLAAGLGKPLSLNRDALARRIVTDYIDGYRTADEIEAAVMRDHPALLASPEEIRRFVRSELRRSGQ